MILHADIESRSAADLKLTGVYVYAEHPTTEILCVSWRLDAGPITTWYPTTSTRPGQPIPPALRAAFADPAVIIVAHNSGFERLMFSGPPGRRIGVPDVSDVARWNCTAARAACAGLPRDLGGAAQAIGLSIAKDTAGALLMRKMCKPRRGGGWWDTPEMHARLGAYCETDVAVESMLDAELPQLTPVEAEVWRLTERMNDRGVLIDQALLLDVSFLIEAAEADINRRLSDMTGGAVPRVSDHGALTRWLQAFGIGDDGVGKQALAAMLDRDDLSGLVRDVLTLRQEGGKSSAAKYRAMLARLSGDGRARGALVYCGAGASSRFSSRGIQLQNMPRGGTVKNIEGAIRDLRDGATLAELEEIHGPAMVLASELIRPTIHAPPGTWLARGDYSQIEARVLAWLSGADWKLDAFRAYDAGTGPDLYRIAAAGIYGVDVAAVTKDQRQIGKVCLGPCTKVLTQRGWVRIVAVEDTDYLWDGVEWTTHTGLVFQGVKPTLQWFGLTLTPDHKILCGNEWIAAGTVSSHASTGRRALATGSANLPWSGIGSAQKAACWRYGFAALAGARNILSTSATYVRDVARAVTHAPKSHQPSSAKSIGVMQMCARIPSIAGGCSIASPLVSHGASRRPTLGTDTTAVEGFAYSLLGPRARSVGKRFLSTLCRCLDGMSRPWNWIGSTATAITHRAICGSSPTAQTRRTSERSANYKSGSRNLKPVYDLTNAGPRRRFTVLTNRGPVLVHNCELALGYGGGKGAFLSMAKVYGVTVAEERAEEIKVLWRQANPEVADYTTGLWASLERAALDCAAGPPGRFYPVGNRGVGFRRNSRAMAMRMPSGRSLAIWSPRIGLALTPWGEERPSLLCHSVNPLNNRWEERSIYGGLLCATLTQATARELMAAALVRLQAEGVPAILTVHDEAVAEVPESRFPRPRDAAAEVERIMRQVPEWAAGLPVSADSSAGRRYVKA